jgi:hypothetical protein
MTPTGEYLVLEFQMLGLRPFFFQYMLPEDRIGFQQSIILGGLFMGLGMSGITRIAFGFLRQRYGRKLQMCQKPPRHQFIA